MNGILSDTKSDTLVILCHGYTASKDIDGLVHLAGSLGKRGISTYRFDFTDKHLSLKQEVADLDEVIKQFGSYRRIYLLGHSLGILPVLINSKKPVIKGIISVNGFFQGKIYRRDFKRAYQMLRLLRFVVPQIKSEWQLMETYIRPEVISKPMLLITTKNDDVLDYHQTVVFGSQLKQSHAVEVVPLSDHGISAIRDGEIIAHLILQWIT